MNQVLKLQRLAVAEEDEKEGNSGTSLTCAGNSCISFNCSSKPS
jgi:hypothetical protein